MVLFDEFDSKIINLNQTKPALKKKPIPIRKNSPPPEGIQKFKEFLTGWSVKQSQISKEVPQNVKTLSTIKRSLE